MADDEAQGQEGSSRPAFEASTDSSLLSASFEPLVWPESRTWEEPPAWDAAAEPVLTQAPLPHGDVQWQATGHDADSTAHLDQALAGLGGGAEVAAPGADGDMGLISTSAFPTPPLHPAAEQGSEGPRWRRFDIRRGNVAVVGLISLVSLVLLGMFLSVRARNEVPTDSSQSRRPSDEISVTGSLNTIPLTTTAPTAAINIADLLPAVDAGASPSGGATAADAGSGSGSSATTAAPSRGGTGSGGGGGSTTPTTQPAARAPAPTSLPAAAPTVEDSPPEETSPPPADNPPPRRPTRTFTFPTFPTTADDDGPSYPFPSWSDIED